MHYIFQLFLSVADAIKNKITDEILKHEVVEEEIKKPEYGPKTKKHLHQASSILGILEKYGLLKSETCYIEFGAGKGKILQNITVSV